MHKALATASGPTGRLYLVQERPFGGPLPTSSAGEDQREMHDHGPPYTNRPERAVSLPTDVDRRDLRRWS